jgi:hypothetical protein
VELFPGDWAGWWRTLEVRWELEGSRVELFPGDWAGWSDVREGLVRPGVDQLFGEWNGWERTQEVS